MFPSLLYVDCWIKGIFWKVLQMFQYIWISTRVKIKCLMVIPSWGFYWSWLCKLLNGYVSCSLRWRVFSCQCIFCHADPNHCSTLPIFIFCISVWLVWIGPTLTSNSNFSMANWFYFSTLPSLFWWQWWSYCCIFGSFWRAFKRTFTE